jgi:hypothetical protein
MIGNIVSHGYLDLAIRSVDSLLNSDRRTSADYFRALVAFGRPYIKRRLDFIADDPIATRQT